MTSDDRSRLKDDELTGRYLKANSGMPGDRFAVYITDWLLNPPLSYHLLYGCSLFLLVVLILTSTGTTLTGLFITFCAFVCGMAITAFLISRGFNLTTDVILARIKHSKGDRSKSFPVDYSASSFSRMNNSGHRRIYSIVRHLLRDVSDNLNYQKLENLRLAQKFEQLTRAAPYGIMLLNEKGVSVLFSSYFSALLEISEEDLNTLRRSESDALESFVIEDDREHYRRAKRIAGKHEDVTVRLQTRTAGGREFWVEVRFVPFEGELQEPACLIVVVDDITDEMGLVTGTTTEKKTRMISHDLRAPIVGIRGLAHALLEDQRERIDSDGLELLNHIIDTSERMNLLLNELVTARPAKAGSESADLNIVLDFVRQDLSELVRSCQASVLVASGLPPLKGNPGKIYRVFLNIIENALKYRHPDRSPVITVEQTGSRGNLVGILVRDNGTGIDEGRIEDVFSFQYRCRVETTRRGDGIGLFTVATCVRELGGTLEASSEKGKGSIFAVYLPVADSQDLTFEDQKIPA